MPTAKPWPFFSGKERAGSRERLNFGPQNPDVSWGRYPDGSTETRIMSPTPGATNVMSKTHEAEVQPLEMYPSPFSQRLYIHAEKIEKPYYLMVMNMFGQVVYEAGDLRQERVSLHREGLPAGLYSVMVWDAKGKRYAGKVVAE